MAGRLYSLHLLFLKLRRLGVYNTGVVQTSSECEDVETRQKLKPFCKEYPQRACPHIKEAQPVALSRPILELRPRSIALQFEER